MLSGNTSPTHQEHIEIPNTKSNEDKVEVTLENSEDDLVNYPANARNWSSGRKWMATVIVSVLDIDSRQLFPQAQAVWMALCRTTAVLSMVLYLC